MKWRVNLKQSPRNDWNEAEGFFPSQSADEFFSQAKTKRYISQLRNVISCPSRQFHTVYMATLNNFVEWCQAMPLNQHGSFAKPYGLFEHAIERTLIALNLRLGEMFPKGAGAEQIAAEDPLWTYAIFTVALFNGIETVTSDRIVELYQTRHASIGEWCSLTPLYQANIIYRLRFIEGDRKGISALQSKINQAALLSRLIPSQALRWLYTNESLFSQWWSLISGQTCDDNDLVVFLNNINNKLPESFLHFRLPQSQNDMPRHVINNTHDFQQSIDVEHAHQFIDWLIAQINTLELLINDEEGIIFDIEGGWFLVMPALANKYLKDKLEDQPEYNHQSIIDALNQGGYLVQSKSGLNHRYKIQNIQNTKNQSLHGCVLPRHSLSGIEQEYPRDNQLIPFEPTEEVS